MSQDPRLDLEYVVHNTHLMRYKSPVGKGTTIFASPPLDRMPSVEPLMENEERTYSLYITDQNGKLLRKLIFFESDYREALKNSLVRRSGKDT